MKRFVLTSSVCVLLAGCTIEKPDRTFQMAGVVCSSTGGKVEIDASFLSPFDVIDTNAMNPHLPSTPDASSLTDRWVTWIKACGEFLSGQDVAVDARKPVLNSALAGSPAE